MYPFCFYGNKGLECGRYYTYTRVLFLSVRPQNWKVCVVESCEKHSRARSAGSSVHAEKKRQAVPPVARLYVVALEFGSVLPRDMRLQANILFDCLC